MPSSGLEATCPVPEGVLAEIGAIAASHGATEAWLFGSAADDDRRHEPNDWDFAILGVPSANWDELSACLRKHFPNSRVQPEFDYTKCPHGVVRGRQTPLHFILGTANSKELVHPISSSINFGKRIWPVA